MAGKKISELQALTEITGQEMIPVARDGQNYSVLSSLLQGGDATKLNDYMYDVSELMGKMAVRGTQGRAQVVPDGDGSGAYNVDGTIGESNLAHATRYAKPNHVYYFDISYSPISPKPESALLLLFDKDDKILKAIPATEAPIKSYLCFTSEVYKYGVSYSLFPGTSSDFTKEYEIQDINDIISNINTNIETNTTSISSIKSDINTSQGNRALYVAAGAVYNEQTGFYELNGLTDITEEQMREIYTDCCSNVQVASLQERYSYSQMRTNFRFKDNYGGWVGGFNVQNMCYGCTSLEVFAVSSSSNFLYVVNCARMFLNCSRLRAILGGLKFNPTITNYTLMFGGCALLEKVKCNGIVASISFSDSPLLSLESLQYLITNAANTSAITVTVHADVYAKIQDESQADWHALIASAQEKQITFATA